MPTLNTVASLANALGTTVAELLDEPAPRHSAATVRLIKIAEDRNAKVRKAILDVVKRFVGCLDDAST